MKHFNYAQLLLSLESPNQGQGQMGCPERKVRGLRWKNVNVFARGLRPSPAPAGPPGQHSTPLPAPARLPLEGNRGASFCHSRSKASGKPPALPQDPNTLC